MTYRLRSHWWVDPGIIVRGWALGVRHILTKKLTFLVYFTEGSNFKENNTVQSSRGGSTLFRVDPTFS